MGPLSLSYLEFVELLGFVGSSDCGDFSAIIFSNMLPSPFPLLTLGLVTCTLVCLMSQVSVRLIHSSFFIFLLLRLDDFSSYL